MRKYLFTVELLSLALVSTAHAEVPIRMPEGGMTALLLCLALGGLAAIRRR